MYYVASIKKGREPDMASGPGQSCQTQYRSPFWARKCPNFLIRGKKLDRFMRRRGVSLLQRNSSDNDVLRREHKPAEYAVRGKEVILLATETHHDELLHYVLRIASDNSQDTKL